MLFKTFRWSLLITAIAFVGAAVIGGTTALALVAILSILEISLSFDNAVVNATILVKMNDFWQRIFLSVGIIIAVFGMRLLFPLLLVGITAQLNPVEAIHLALEGGSVDTPGTYAQLLAAAHPSIAAFGGLFLLMLFLDFVFEDRDIRWLTWLETPLARIGKLDQLTVVVAATALILTAELFAKDAGAVMVAGTLGIVTYLLVNGLGQLFELGGEDSAADTDLADTDLSGTGLADTDLADTDLAGTDLAGTDLAGTDLAGTDLAGVNLAGVGLRSGLDSDAVAGADTGAKAAVEATSPRAGGRSSSGPSELAKASGKAAFFLFLYLEVIDASFSFDGVIGAFAITQDIFIIATGLGVGAMYIRSLTVYLVHKGTLNEYVYLEHGAHWAIGALAAILLVSIAHEIPEVVTGLVGVGFIGAAFVSSILRNRRHGLNDVAEVADDQRKPVTAGR